MSVEGTVAGVGGSIIMAVAGYFLNLINTPGSFVACIIAAFVGTTAESYIGATYQKGWLTNELVNFINTLIGATAAMALVVWFS